MRSAPQNTLSKKVIENLRSYAEKHPKIIITQRKDLLEKTKKLTATDCLLL